MVTLSPAIPLVGLKVVILGTGLNIPVLVEVPSGPITLIVAIIASAGTVARIEVADRTVKSVALMLPNCTSVAPDKPVPVIVTLVPAMPETGVNEVIFGGIPTNSETVLRRVLRPDVPITFML